MTTTTAAVDTTELDTFLATLRDQVLSGEMTLDHLRWYSGLTFDQREALMEDADPSAEEAGSTCILHPIVEALTVGITDGTEIIPNAKDVFLGGIDNDFVNWGANEASSATSEIKTTVYEMREDATYKQMFESISTDTKKLCMTQSQIIHFVKTHRQHLRTDGYATLFLFESNKKFFVASVYFVDVGRLWVSVRRLEFDDVWDAGYQHRVVVPQL